MYTSISSYLQQLHQYTIVHLCKQEHYVIVPIVTIQDDLRTETDKVHTLERTALHRDRELDQCKVCIYIQYKYEMEY